MRPLALYDMGDPTLIKEARALRVDADVEDSCKMHLSAACNPLAICHTWGHLLRSLQRTPKLRIVIGVRWSTNLPISTQVLPSASRGTSP